MNIPDTFPEYVLCHLKSFNLNFCPQLIASYRVKKSNRMAYGVCGYVTVTAYESMQYIIDAIKTALKGHCCSTNYLCPNKVDFYIEESNAMPRSCTLGAFITCPNGYTCQSTQNNFSTGYCCKGELTSVSGKNNFYSFYIVDSSQT